MILVRQKTTKSSFFQREGFEGTKSDPAAIILDPGWGEHVGESDPALTAPTVWADSDLKTHQISFKSSLFRTGFIQFLLSVAWLQKQRCEIWTNSSKTPNLEVKAKTYSADEQVIPQTLPLENALSRAPTSPSILCRATLHIFGFFFYLFFCLCLCSGTTRCVLRIFSASRPSLVLRMLFSDAATLYRPCKEVVVGGYL